MVLEGLSITIAAVASGEEHQSRKIHFVLPAEMQRRRLTSDEVAALVVKASSTLVAAAAATAYPSSPLP